MKNLKWKERLKRKQASCVWFENDPKALVACSFIIGADQKRTQVLEHWQALTNKSGQDQDCHKSKFESNKDKVHIKIKIAINQNWSQTRICRVQDLPSPLTSLLCSNKAPALSLKVLWYFDFVSITGKTWVKRWERKISKILCAVGSSSLVVLGPFLTAAH